MVEGLGFYKDAQDEHVPLPPESAASTQQDRERIRQGHLKFLENAIRMSQQLGKPVDQEQIEAHGGQKLYHQALQNVAHEQQTGLFE